MSELNAGGGRVITFYSYKGGTGRSMALANVAWILASHGRRVLCIDWDLEAPGLHRYFAPFLIDADLFSTDGLIDFVWASAQAMVTPTEPSRTAAEPVRQSVTAADLADAGDYIVRLDFDFPGEGALDLLPAGRQGASYAERVNTFDWDHFYERLGGGRLLNGLGEQLRAEYDFILIDSRTGVSDTSGICTVQLPDALVVLFTLNKQSMRGAEAVAQSVREQRPELPIFPVPTRVDPFEADKVRAGFRAARSTFAPFVDQLFAMGATRGEPAAYWGDVEFPYIPYFAFEEVLAPFAEERGRRSTFLAAATRLASHVAGESVPEPEPVPEELRLQCLAAYGHEEPGPAQVPLQQRAAAGRAASVAAPSVLPAAPQPASQAASQAASQGATGEFTRMFAPGQPAGEVPELPAPAAAAGTPAAAKTTAQTAASSAIPARSAGSARPAWLGRPGLVYIAAGVMVAFALTAMFVGYATLGSADDEFPTYTEEDAMMREQLLASLRDSGTVYTKKVTLRRIYQQSRSLTGEDLSGNDFSELPLTGIILRNATLRDVRFVGAKLDSADFSGADLTGANLSDAGLQAADLRGAILEGAILNGANLFGARLESAALATAKTDNYTVLHDSTPGPYRLDEDISVETSAAPVAGRIDGWVWIGNYDRRRGVWEKVLLADAAGVPITTDPALLAAPGTYSVLGNLRARKALPANDRGYFAVVPVLGVVPRGSQVTLMGQPQEFARPTGLTQYWVRIAVDHVQRY